MPPSLLLLLLAAPDRDLIPPLDLILYGATGCVGHFAATHLSRQAGLRWAIADRNATKLSALASSLRASSSPSQPELIVASLSQHMQWVRRAAVVATAAGPYSIHGGAALLKACAENGVHYADLSDEFPWQRRMIDAHDHTARRSGARVVLGAGFCALAGEMGSQLAIEKMADGVPRRRTVHSPGDDVSVDAWLEEYNGGVSAGVINTPHNLSYPKQWDLDPYVLAPNASASLRIDSTVEGMSYPSWVAAEGVVVPSIFGAYDARLLRRAFVHHGQRVRLRVGAAPGMYARWAAFLAIHPSGWGSLTSCPAPVLFEKGAWKYRFQARGGDRKSEVVLSGRGDPGYYFTSIGLAETALCLAGKTVDCIRSDSPGGVGTVSMALRPDAIADRLRHLGALEVE